MAHSVVTRSGKGGTYFGATGCGKTYTMAFLARQLALRCTDIPEIGSPTIILIVDRDELQKQGSKLFTKSKEFLNLGEVSVVKNRTQLRQELGARQSGGFYICTIQKFCDREDDKIGLINDRQNIICFSDEAHRTQLEHSKKIQFSKDADENMKAIGEYAETLGFEEESYLDLFQAVMELDKKYRVPVLLFYYERYSTAEIASILKIPKKTVSTRLFRAKAKLKNYLKEE